jgi:hypothetical protein
MTGTTATAPANPAADEAARYLADVAAHLSALPPAERDELLDDLQQHLLEVAAEEGPSLLERLGPPAAYAADLLASVGAPADAAERRVPLRDHARRWIRAVEASPRGAAALAYVKSLRPAWWLARGLIVGWWLTVVMLNADVGRWLIFPEARGRRVPGVVAVLAATLVSVLIGLRTSGLGRGWRRAVMAGNVAVALMAVFLTTTRQAYPADSVQGYYVGPPPGQCLTNRQGQVIENLYPYDAEGRPLDRVLLYDQTGQPVDNLCPATTDPYGRPVKTEYGRDANGAAVINVFPRKQSMTDSPTPAPTPAPAIVVPKLAPTTTTTTAPTTTTAAPTTAAPTTTSTSTTVP